MNVIITGASKGIGFHTAMSFAKEKNNIIVISRNRKLLNKLKKECRSMGLPGRVYTVPFDLGRDDIEDALGRFIRSIFQNVDILINNAGVIVNKAFGELSPADFDHMFNINVKSVFRLCQIVSPMMDKGSHILNIGSMGGVQGSAKFSGLSLYSASKGALAILTECLAGELKDQGVFVNCLALGAVQTEMLSEAFPGYKAPVSEEDMGAFVENFASNGKKFINGKIIPISLSTP